MTPTLQSIKEVVASHYGVKVADLESARLGNGIVRPRQIAMFIGRRLTSKTLPQIGMAFGDRDHSTVIHSVRKIEHLRVEDEDLDFEISALTRRVLSQHQHALNDALIGWAA